MKNPASMLSPCVNAANPAHLSLACPRRPRGSLGLSAALLLASLMPLAASTASAAASEVRETATHSSSPSPIHKLTIPDTFDEGDHIQVVLEGAFTRSCQRPSQVAYHLDQDQGLIEVWAYQEERSPAELSAEDCQAGHYPFIQVVDLGKLPAGQYQVTYRPEALTEALTIQQQTSDTPSAPLYAPVDYIAVSPSAADKTNTLPDQGPMATSNAVNADTQENYDVTLVGTFPYLYIGCMRFKGVHTSRGPQAGAQDVVVIRPEVEVLEDARACTRHASAGHKFEVSTSLPNDNAGETTLLHIRLPDGRALNHLVVHPD